MAEPKSANKKRRWVLLSDESEGEDVASAELQARKKHRLRPDLGELWSSASEEEEEEEFAADLPRQQENTALARSTHTVDLVTPSIFLFVGPPESGKTYTLEYILKMLWQAGRFRFGMVFSPNLNAEETGGGYKKWIKNKTALVPDGPKPAYIVKYLDVVEQKQKEWKLPQPPPNFLVFEDPLGSVNWRDPELVKLIANFRHHGTSLFVVSQWNKMLTTLLRGQAHYPFIFYVRDTAAIDGLHEAYGGDFENKEAFRRFYRQIVQVPHQAMFIDGRAPPYEIQKKYLAYKAPEKQLDVVMKF